MYVCVKVTIHSYVCIHVCICIHTWSSPLHWPFFENSVTEVVGRRGPGMGFDSPALKVEPNALYLNTLPLHEENASCAHVCIHSASFSIRNIYILTIQIQPVYVFCEACAEVLRIAYALTHTRQNTCTFTRESEFFCHLPYSCSLEQFMCMISFTSLR
jgi:hypothetical protein